MVVTYLSKLYKSARKTIIIAKGIIPLYCRVSSITTIVFMDINVGCTRSVHDARVLVNSEQFQKGVSGELFPQKLRKVNGVSVSPLILGDPVYDLLQWIMKPYSDNGRLSQLQCLFNYRLSHARVATENAFGRLKGQWRCLLKRNDTHNSRMPTVIAVCAILHNICEIHSDEFNHEWLENLKEIAINCTVAETEDAVATSAEYFNE